MKSRGEPPRPPARRSGQRAPSSLGTPSRGWGAMAVGATLATGACVLLAGLLLQGDLHGAPPLLTAIATGLLGLLAAGLWAGLIFAGITARELKRAAGERRRELEERSAEELVERYASLADALARGAAAVTRQRGEAATSLERIREAGGRQSVRERYAHQLQRLDELERRLRQVQGTVARALRIATWHSEVARCLAQAPRGTVQTEDLTGVGGIEALHREHERHRDRLARLREQLLEVPGDGEMRPVRQEARRLVALLDRVQEQAERAEQELRLLRDEARLQRLSGEVAQAMKGAPAGSEAIEALGSLSHETERALSAAARGLPRLGPEELDTAREALRNTGTELEAQVRTTLEMAALDTHRSRR